MSTVVGKIPDGPESLQLVAYIERSGHWNLDGRVGTAEHQQVLQTLEGAQDLIFAAQQYNNVFKPLRNTAFQ